MPSANAMKLAFVSSAFNEEENLEELHRRCRAVHAELQREFADRVALEFRFVVADNGSTDRSVAVLEGLTRRDPAQDCAPKNRVTQVRIPVIRSAGARPITEATWWNTEQGRDELPAVSLSRNSAHDGFRLKTWVTLWQQHVHTLIT